MQKKRGSNKKDSLRAIDTDQLYRKISEKTLYLLQQKILRQDWLLQAILEFIGDFGIYDDFESMSVKIKNHKKLRDTLI